MWEVPFKRGSITFVDDTPVVGWVYESEVPISGWPPVVKDIHHGELVLLGKLAIK